MSKLCIQQKIYTQYNDYMSLNNYVGVNFERCYYSCSRMIPLRVTRDSNCLFIGLDKGFWLCASRVCLFLWDMFSFLTDCVEPLPSTAACVSDSRKGQGCYVLVTKTRVAFRRDHVFDRYYTSLVVESRTQIDFVILSSTVILWILIEVNCHVT